MKKEKRAGFGRPCGTQWQPCAPIHYSGGQEAISVIPVLEKGVIELPCRRGSNWKYESIILSFFSLTNPPVTHSSLYHMGLICVHSTGFFFCKLRLYLLPCIVHGALQLRRSPPKPPFFTLSPNFLYIHLKYFHCLVEYLIYFITVISCQVLDHFTPESFFSCSSQRSLTDLPCIHFHSLLSLKQLRIHPALQNQHLWTE